ncbi:secreted RxLR effector protein 161-like [Arachis hypogaea]|uniref:secreted RxLR effector protein 161-like n=1 Tax=Arachis hypogaea TaxID=3818 RepID=UPI003B20BD94
MDYTTYLSRNFGSPLPDAALYRRLIGRLFYLTNTRPDLSYPVGCLSQFMDCPTDVHLKAVYRVIRYLKQSPASGLFFSASNSLILSGYTDSDWGACKDTRKSITSYYFFLDQTLISWKSKKQTTVSRSSSEAEYRALANGTCKLVWLLKLLKEFKISPPVPVDIFCDNKSAIYIASNSVFHERTKHVEIDCHVARNKYKEGVSNL